MSDDLTNPHDKFFKDLFSRHQAARDFLQHYLPPEVTPLLDLTTLEIHKDSFIDPDLQEHFSDLLYQVTLRTGQETFIYLLFEHKSYPEPLIALQLLRYMVRIWEQALKQREPLLPVLPLVLYHGAKRWTVAEAFSALFDLPAELRPYLPDYRYWLCDLSRYSDEELKAAITLQAQLMVLKYILRDGFGQRFGEMVGMLRALLKQERGMEQLYTLLRYVAGASEQVSQADFIEVVEAIFNETGENLMPTLAEQWTAEAFAKGKQAGKLEGREEGREATLTILWRYLAARFGLELDHFEADFALLDLEAIIDLSEIAFEVNTLAEFETALANLKARVSDDTDQTNAPPKRKQ